MRLLDPIHHRDSSLVLLARNDMLGAVSPRSVGISSVDRAGGCVRAHGLVPLHDLRPYVAF
jgi:hypothetical protein